MKQSLINLKDKLKDAGFRFEASTSVYNPMERFADYVSTKEIVHSKIIADLLNPKGEHQLGYGFLLKFLQAIKIDVPLPHFPEVEIPIKSEVEIERYAPTSLDGIETKGRIDILLRVELVNKKKYAIIIENKLNDAPEQFRQLERYNDYVEKELGYNADERITVYMPRIKCEYDGTIIIDATQLADILEIALKESISPNKATIQAYANYLRNISVKNIIMDNSRRLADMLAEDILNAKAIKDAYDKLPDAFAENLKDFYDGNNGLKAEVSSKYPSYCYIWNPKAYGKTCLWLAIGFDYDSYSVYIVSNNVDIEKYPEYLAKLKIAKTSQDNEGHWHKPIKIESFAKKFNGKPKCEEIKSDIDTWLELLNEVAEIK